MSPFVVFVKPPDSLNSHFFLFFLENSLKKAGMFPYWGHFGPFSFPPVFRAALRRMKEPAL
jgi:hypothetical protein